MQAFYNIGGDVISTFLWGDLLKNDDFREVIEVQKVKDGKMLKPFKKKIFKDDDGVFFFWNKNKVYVNDFNYMTVEEMIEYIKSEKISRTPYFNDKLFATIMRDTDNVGLLFDLPVYETIVSSLGIALTGEKRVKALCIPTEKRYKKDSWHYKLTLETANEIYRKTVSYDHLYFSDFASLVLSGHIELVVKDKFIEEQEEIANRKLSLKEKILKFFKKKEETERILY